MMLHADGLAGGCLGGNIWVWFLVFAILSFLFAATIYRLILS